MAIVKQTNKKTGITYVYESFSYRDKDTKQPRSKRKLIGRIDEATGNVIPTRKQNRNVTTDDTVVPTTSLSQPTQIDFAELQKMELTISELRKQNAQYLKERKALAAELERLRQMLD